jgi:hypothetical protein
MAVKSVVVLGGFLALAAVKTWPLLAHFGTRLGAQGSDALLVTWILAWDVHALTTRPLRLFDANLSYPIERSLAFSDHLLGVVPLFAPVYLVTGNAVAGYNALLLLSFVLSACGAFALAWSWTRNWWPSIVAGVLFGFAPLRLSQIGHLQLLTFFWAPWALLFLDRVLRGRRWVDLAAFTVFYSLQVLSSFYFGVMLTVAVVLYAGYYAVAIDRRLPDRAMTARIVVGAAASFIVLLPFHLPYAAVQRAWEASWTLGAMAGYSADVQSYLSAPALLNDLYVAVFRPITPVGAHERLLFPGLVLPILVLVGSVAPVRGVAQSEIRRLRRLFGLIAVVAVVLSLGPYLIVFGVNTHIPLPYLLPYYVVPGWSAMRVPARFAFLALLATVPVAALGVQALIERVAAARPLTAGRRLAPPAVALALVGFFLLELGTKPWPLQAVPTGRDVPEVYRWLARARPGPIVEIPLDLLGRDEEYLYLSTVHWLPIVNGRSGFGPSSHDEIKTILAELPGTRGHEYAAALGLRAMVVHGNRLSREERIRWAAAEEAGHVRRLAAFGPDVVYAVTPVALAPSLRARIAAPAVLPPGAEVRLGLRLDNDDVRPWAHGRPHRLDHAVVRWSEPAAGRTSTTSVPVTLPLVVGSGESAPIPFRVTAPLRPGRYELDVALAGQGVAAERRAIEVRESTPLPTSADAHRLLAAGYAVEGGLGPRVIAAAESLRVRVAVLNTGGAVWLAKGRGKRGDVALYRHWLTADGREVAGGAGQTRIRYDVYPGQRYEFDEWIAGPVDGGRYVLELGLASGGVGPFVTGGGAPVTVTVDVGRRATAAVRP